MSITDLGETSRERNAFTKIVSFWSYGGLSNAMNNNTTMIGFGPGGNGWKGGAEHRDAWDDTKKHIGNDLYTSCRIDFQTNIGRSAQLPEGAAQLQVQMTRNNEQISAACIIVPYKQEFGARAIREAFIRSQGTQTTVML